MIEKKKKKKKKLETDMAVVRYGQDSVEQRQWELC